MTEDEMKETIAPEEKLITSEPSANGSEVTRTSSGATELSAHVAEANGCGACEDAAEELRRELTASREEAEQLRRERFLLLKGIPEEDLDYYVFKIGKLTEDGTAFAEAAEAFLKKQEKKQAHGLFRSGAKLSGGAPRAATANETMNRLIRGI